MKLLLDQGLPRSTAEILRTAGRDVVHTGEIGMATAEDQAIIDRAATEGRVVVTLDSDFHTLLALAGASTPSVVRIRIDGLKAQSYVDLIERVVEACADELATGAAVSVTQHKVRIHMLPLIEG
jgi:predicted nuclease of predicted toxin-antitoxin system